MRPFYCLEDQPGLLSMDMESSIYAQGYWSADFSQSTVALSLPLDCNSSCRADNFHICNPHSKAYTPPPGSRYCRSLQSLLRLRGARGHSTSRDLHPLSPRERRRGIVRFGFPATANYLSAVLARSCIQRIHILLVRYSTCWSSDLFERNVLTKMNHVIDVHTLNVRHYYFNTINFEMCDLPPRVSQRKK